MVKCAICLKQFVRGIGTFYKVPLDEKRRLLWQNNCGVLLRSKDHICADHFLREDIICSGKQPRLMPKAVPHPLMRVATSNCAPPIQPALSSELCYNQSAEDSPDLCVTEVAPKDVDSYNISTNIESYSTNNNINSSLIVENVDSQTQTSGVLLEDSATQTSCLVFEALISPEILNLRSEVKRLKAENKDISRKLDESNVVLGNFRNIFTEGQMRKMAAPDKNIYWNWQDISSAICLNAAGPRAYHHLYENGFPLPSMSTLHRWSRKTDISEGLIAASFQTLSNMSVSSDDDKICVLSFDEMKVAEAFEFDEVGEQARKPAKMVQVAMVRGLLKSWKQPIFYAFDTPMTKDILFSIIIALKDINFQVVAIVSDNGQSNRTLWWTALKTTIDDPWFPHPSDSSLKVYVFSDPPHLLKLVRNHYIDDEFIWNNQRLGTRTICDLLNHTSSSDVSIAYKISHDHLGVKGAARQKVKTAAQLFSNSVASAIRRCHALGYPMYNALQTADFIQLVNDWFDVLNSNMRNFAYPGKEPFGRDLSNQMDILNRMNEFMSVPIIPGKAHIEIFQKGILMTNRALVGLYNYLKEKSNVEYLLTSRLNQDVLEHLFGAIRSKGGLNDHPTPKEFQYRLRKYILARNTETLRPTGNVSKETTEWAVPQGSSTPLKASTSANLSASVVSSANESSKGLSGSAGSKENQEPDDEDIADVISAVDTSFPDDCGILKEDALSYISGYMIKKLKLEELQDTRSSIGFVDEVSKGFLKKPTPHLLHGVKAMEKIFEQVNGSEISTRKNLHKTLVNSSANVDVPESVKRLFFKCRIHFRIRSLNRRLKVQKAKQRLVGFKKFLKIKL